MPKFSSVVPVFAHPRMVWEVLAAYHRVDHWAPEIEAVEGYGTRLGVGAVRTVHIHGKRVEQEVKVWEPGRAFAFLTHAHGPYKWVLDTFRIKSYREHSRVRFDVRAQYKMPGLGLWFDRQLEERSTGILAALKKYVEGEDIPSIVQEPDLALLGELEELDDGPPPELPAVDMEKLMPTRWVTYGTPEPAPSR